MLFNQLISGTDSNKHPYKLDYIFNKQKELTETVYSKYKNHLFNCYNFTENEFKIWYALTNANQEIAETIQMLNHKVWKEQKKEIDKEKILEELVDSVHFLIQAMLLLGYDAEDMFNKYLEKNKVNFDRQKNGY